jgi:hypothetical protein
MRHFWAIENLRWIIGSRIVIKYKNRPRILLMKRIYTDFFNLIRVSPSDP